MKKGRFYGDTHLGGFNSLYQAPNQTESSPQVREVRRKKRVVLQRCRGRGLYMVRGSATALFLRETHTWCWCQESSGRPERKLWPFKSMVALVFCYDWGGVIFLSDEDKGQKSNRKCCDEATEGGGTCNTIKETLT